MGCQSQVRGWVRVSDLWGPLEGHPLGFGGFLPPSLALGAPCPLSLKSHSLLFPLFLSPWGQMRVGSSPLFSPSWDTLIPLNEARGSLLTPLGPSLGSSSSLRYLFPLGLGPQPLLSLLLGGNGTFLSGVGLQVLEVFTLYPLLSLYEDWNSLRDDERGLRVLL